MPIDLPLQTSSVVFPSNGADWSQGTARSPLHEPHAPGRYPKYLRLLPLNTARRNIKAIGFGQKEQACLSGPVNLLKL